MFKEIFSSDLEKSRSRCAFTAFAGYRIVSCGDWGGASTSRNQAFPIEWKCLVLCLCIYEGIACR